MPLQGGEFGAIDRIRRALAQRVTGAASGVAAGVGDDCAVLRAPAGQRLLATVDMLVEGVHFTREHLPPDALGRRALAVNLSDIASMGGRPLWALISLALPAWVDDGYLDALYRGLGAMAEPFGVAVVGGNMTRLPERLAVDVTLLGAARRPVLRSGARPGDALLVTGSLGGAAAGLAALRGGTPAAPHLLRAQLEPQPRVAEGQALGDSGLVHAMIDISDGLAQDLGHLCDESGVGAALQAASVPVAPGATLEQALHGGEDYELLLAVAPASVGRLPPEVHLTQIGEVRPAAEGLTLDGRPLAALGWDHFAPRGG